MNEWLTSHFPIFWKNKKRNNSQNQIAHLLEGQRNIQLKNTIVYSSFENTQIFAER